MKTLSAFLVPMVVLILTAPSAAQQRSDSSEGSVTLWIVWDTSGSNRSVWKEERALAWAAVGALETGDRLRLVSAHRDRPRLLLLERISEGRTRQDLLATFEDVEAEHHRADVSRALGVVLSATPSANERLPAGTVVMVLTDGCLTSKESAKVVETIVTLEERGATVMITGVRETAREILLAVARGELHWQRLNACDPAKWIAETRSNPSRDSLPPIKFLEQRVVEGTPPLVEPGEGALKSFSLEFRTEVREGETPSGDRAGADEGNPIESEEDATRTPLAAAAGLPAETREILPGEGATKRGGKLLWLSLIAAGLLGLAVAGLLAPDAIRVLRRHVRDQRTGSASGKGKPCQLVAEVDGAQQVLGPAHRLRRFHAGSGAENALRVQGEGVEQRHLKFFRRVAWWVTNLSRRPVEVNGKVLPAGKRERITFPAGIRIGQRTRIRMFLRSVQTSLAGKGSSPGDQEEGTRDEIHA